MILVPVAVERNSKNAVGAKAYLTKPHYIAERFSLSSKLADPAISSVHNGFGL